MYYKLNKLKVLLQTLYQKKQEGEMGLRDALKDRVNGEIIDISELVDLAEGYFLDEFCGNNGCQGSQCTIKKIGQEIRLICLECSNDIKV